MFADHVKGYAILDYKNRKNATSKEKIFLKGKRNVVDSSGNIKTFKDGNPIMEDCISENIVDVIEIHSNSEDMSRAYSLDGETTKEETFITDKEKIILSKIPYGEQMAMSIDEIAKASRLSPTYIYRALFGRKERNQLGLDRLDYIRSQKITITSTLNEETRVTKPRIVIWRTDEPSELKEKDDRKNVAEKTVS